MPKSIDSFGPSSNWSAVSGAPFSAAVIAVVAAAMLSVITLAFSTAAVAQAVNAAQGTADGDTAKPGAHSLVASTTERVMAVVTAAEAYADQDPERYYGEIQTILDPLIDYRGFARNVMGPYASSKRYRSLDEAGREELRSQLDTFTNAMQQSLIRTYSKGLLAFGEARIELAMEEPEAQSAKRASVKQLIYAESPQPYVVLYQMGLNKTGDWKLRNVIIESVNLGEIYRDQFLSSARDFDGDLNAVIANWTTVTVDVES